MPDINSSYIWAINTCNDPNIGYSQSYRNQKTVNGITYYDCSSFIFYALKAGGFGVSGYPFTTATMRSKLISLGFVLMPTSGQWLPGDIVWRDGHTEMVYQGGTGQGITMGAHSSKRPLADQVSINSSYTSNFTNVYRYGNGATGGTSYQWIRGTADEYFDEAKMQNNACCVWQFFYAKGWTLNAVAALVGNMEAESTLNPDCIEHGGTGHGLVQWTPPDDLYEVLDYLYGNHTDWGDPDGQCNAIYAEYQKTIGEIPAVTNPNFDKQWYTTFPVSIDMSWYDWAHSTDEPGYLAEVFQRNYERPAAIHPERQEYARKWYNYLKNIDPTGGGGTPGGKLQKLKIWEMIRYHI